MSERVPLAPVPGLTRTAVIPPPSRPRPAVAKAAAEPEMSAAPSDPQPAPPRRPRAARPRASEGATTVRATTLSLPVRLVEALKARATNDRITQVDVLMDALVAAKQELPDLVQVPENRASEDGLFVRRRAVVSEPTATLSIRMLSRNVDAIDELVASHGAKSRSALCAAALNRYLDPKD